MKSILLIIPYFGQWPLWFDAYLTSVKHNPTINWLCPTDCKIPEEYPENIKFLKTDIKRLNKHVNQVVGCNVPLTPRKFCDLKPAYADIFEEEIKAYDFWGFCDLDIIWGDIRQFMTPELLANYDIISSRKEAISGHFNLFKNTRVLNTLYRKIPNYKKLFEYPEFQWTDEQVLTRCLKEHPNFINLSLKIYWETILCNQERGRDSHQEYEYNKWKWENGKMICLKTNQNVMYLHFINWKRTMQYSEVLYRDQPDFFYISFNGMHYQLHSIIQRRKRDFINIFKGYNIQEKQRIRRLKLKSFLKKMKRKLKLN